MKKFFKIGIIGLFIGFTSGLFSAGGGIIALICFCNIFKFDEKEARAITICCILPIALASIFVYKSANLIDFNLGFLCGIGGLIGGLIGSILLGKVSNKYLEIFFIVFIFYSSVKMLIT